MTNKLTSCTSAWRDQMLKGLESFWCQCRAACLRLNICCRRELRERLPSQLLEDTFYLNFANFRKDEYRKFCPGKLIIKGPDSLVCAKGVKGTMKSPTLLYKTNAVDVSTYFKRKPCIKQKHLFLVQCNFLIWRNQRTWGLINISFGVLINGPPI